MRIPSLFTLLYSSFFICFLDCNLDIKIKPTPNADQNTLWLQLVNPINGKYLEVYSHREEGVLFWDHQVSARLFRDFILLEFFFLSLK